jgi:N-sulfoglucosamine sulfohydrolase
MVSSEIGDFTWRSRRVVRGLGKANSYQFTAAMLNLTAVLFGGIMLSQSLSAYADSPRPNILFCIADDASFPHMGAYGCEWVKSPGFDRVARDGVLFTRAYTPNAKCAPSRACILTGRNSWQLEEAANHWCHFPDKFQTYAEVLGENGYFVGYTAKGWGPGTVGKRGGKPRELTGRDFSARRAKPPTGGISSKDYAANFDDFLEARPDDKPFCFWYGAHEPHRGYEFQSGVKKGGKALTDVTGIPDYWPDSETVRHDMLDYAFEVEHFDNHLQRMLALLEKAGELENTLVVVTADNGMPFPRVKGEAYERANHLPLAIMWQKGIQGKGRVIDDYMSFIDFAPTFLELAGVDAATCGMQPIQGRSLTDIFRSDAEGVVNPQRDHVLIGKERHSPGRPLDVGYPIRAIIKGDYLYARNYEPERWPIGDPVTGYLNSDGSPTKTEILARHRDGTDTGEWQYCFGKRPEEELYNLSKDPDCMTNLAAIPEHQTRKLALKQAMEDELKEQADPRMFGQGKLFDAYPYVDPGCQGFYERFMAGEKMKTGWVNQSDFETSLNGPSLGRSGSPRLK